MLSVIITSLPSVRDAFISALSLEKQKDATALYDVYQRGKWVLILDTENNLEKAVEWWVENFNPEHLYLPFFGRVVDIVREVGDVVLPNVIITYNPKIAITEIDGENKDSFLDGAKFLEIYDEQKDYYVEDFGLSIGGIVVDKVPADAPAENLMLAYEGDIYLEGSLDQAHIIASTIDASVVVMVWVIEWKNPKNLSLPPLDHTVRNMVTACRLLEWE